MNLRHHHHCPTVARHDDRGDTLVEIMVTIVIVGLVVTAILGAVMIAMESSTNHRNLANDDAFVKTTLEAVEDQVQLPQSGSGDFVDCGTTSNGPAYIVAAWTTSTTTYGTSKNLSLPALPANYSETMTAQCWNPSTDSFDSICTSVTPCLPSGIVEVTVTIQDPTGVHMSESSVLRNPTYQGAYSGEF